MAATVPYAFVAGIRAAHFGSGGGNYAADPAFAEGWAFYAAWNAAPPPTTSLGRLWQAVANEAWHNILHEGGHQGLAVALAQLAEYMVERTRLDNDDPSTLAALQHIARHGVLAGFAAR